MANNFYNEILTDHNIRPLHKKAIEGANFSLEGVNPSCGDDIVLSLRVENNVVVDGGFTGTLSHGDDYRHTGVGSDGPHRHALHPAHPLRRSLARLCKRTRGGPL